MYERGDLKVLHEPFIYLYYVGDAKKKLKFFEIDPQHPTSYEAIRNMILDSAERGPVFFKDMSYYITDYIFDDPDFIHRVTNTFLIRNPRQSIPSYYNLDECVLSEEIGLEAQWHHFEFVQKITQSNPIVIDAEELQANTETVIRYYCKLLGLDFLKTSLSWDRAVPEEWQHLAGWHGDLDQTAGIGNKQSQKRLVEDDPHLRSLFEHHDPFYQNLKKYCCVDMERY